jgi:ClpX C4-type zinc finger protein
MPDDSAVDVFEASSENWQKAVNRKDFHEAIIIAIGAYLHYRDKRNEQIASGCLNLIHVAIGQLLQLEEQNVPAGSCSFCRRSGTEVRLGAGPNTYICSECIETFHSTFSSKTTE